MSAERAPLQPQLFLESIYDAGKAVVEFCGGAKVVGHQLFPLKSIDDARRALLDALNPDRPEKLDGEQWVALFRLGREAGFHAAKHYFDGVTGYEPSAPLDPKVQQDRAVEAVAAAAAELNRALATLERIKPALRPAA
jgi:hypothetical protein